MPLSLSLLVARLRVSSHLAVMGARTAAERIFLRLDSVCVVRGGVGGGAWRRAFTLTTLRTTRARGAAVETRAGVAPQKASTPQRIQTKSAQDSTKPCGILGAMVRGAAQREARSRVCGVGSRATTGRRLLTTNSSHVLTTNHLSAANCIKLSVRHASRPVTPKLVALFVGGGGLLRVPIYVIARSHHVAWFGVRQPVVK